MNRPVGERGVLNRAGVRGEAMDHDLVVIGAGTAGGTAARTAVGLGARTAIVEEDGFAGTCLTRG